jgi:glyoxylase-like metal-dependent hydrolase (beta-lactamase superfamily II)
LASAGKGTFALLTEVSVGRGVIAIALGTSGLTACAAPAARPAAPAVVPTDAPATTSAPQAPTATAATVAESTVAPTEAAASPTATVATVATLPPVSYNQVNLGFVNAYVLVRGNEVAVVDTGVANSQGKIDEVIKAAGRAWDDVRQVILTHYHPDHIGSMDAVMAASTNATAYAGAEDIPQITTATALQAVGDGSDVFGLQIIATPGHTAGHISVYDPIGSTFIMGDAMANADGTLTGSNPQFSADMAAANESVKKIAGLTFDTAYFMHGLTIESGASEAIAKLAATLQ